MVCKIEAAGTKRLCDQKQMSLYTSESVCAVVVTYFPDSGFIDRLKHVVPQVARIVVVDNTPPEGTAFNLGVAIQELQRVSLIENRRNKGIAVALNQGLAFAVNSGFKWIVTLDQDTQCSSGMVSTLLVLSESCSLKPMVIGCNYMDPQVNRTKVPDCDDDESFLEQKTVITSGSMIDVQRAEFIGGFREDFFIDQVDHEFCLRARAHGYPIIISRKSLMTHSVGRLGGVRLPFLGTLPNHPPVRKYYIARNTVLTVANYWRIEPVWCIRRLVRLFLGLIEMAVLEQQRARKIYAFVWGISDGLRKQTGQCERRFIS